MTWRLVKTSAFRFDYQNGQLFRNLISDTSGQHGDFCL